MIRELLETIADAKPEELMDMMDWCIDTNDIDGYRAIQNEILRRLKSTTCKQIDK